MWILLDLRCSSWSYVDLIGFTRIWVFFTWIYLDFDGMLWMFMDVDEF